MRKGHCKDMEYGEKTEKHGKADTHTVRRKIWREN
jgi:hypothetical protein